MILSKKIQAEWRPRRRFRALRFDGVDDYVEIPTNVVTRKSFSILFGVKVNELGVRVIFDSRDTHYAFGGKGIIFRDSNGDGLYDFIIGDGTNIAGATQKIDLSDLDTHDVVVSVDFVTMYVFVDGSLVGTYDVSTVANEFGGGSLIKICTQFDNSRFVSGNIYYLMIWNVALSDPEIKQLNDNPFNPPRQDNLVLWLTPGSIDPVAGKWYDLSQYGNHGTIYGAQVVEEAVREVIVK